MDKPSATAPPSEADLDEPLLSGGNEVTCMFTSRCNTGSQPRKAISHIFGRNKAATRSIPTHVWVHYCRKHYQRCRYRNAREWVLIQCGLVKEQVRRVQMWSEQNRKAGKGGVVQNWTLAMRKREQNRVQEKSSKQRSFQPTNDEDEDEDTHLDSATLNGTAVPDWLRNKCGDGYSSAEIEDIVDLIKEHLEEVHASQIPDIEILPNITLDPADDTASRAMLKRKASNPHTHRRSQSVGVALHAESQPTPRYIGLPPTAYYDNYSVLRHDNHPAPGYYVNNRDVPPATHHEGHHIPHRDKPRIPPIDDLPFPHRDGRPMLDHHNRHTVYRDNQPTYWSTNELPPSDKRQRLPDIRDDRRAPNQRSLSAIDSYNPDFSFHSPMPPGGYRTEQPVRYSEGQPASTAPGPYERDHDPSQPLPRWSLASRPLEPVHRLPAP